MRFIPLASTLLATAVLVVSGPVAQYDGSLDVAYNFGTAPVDAGNTNGDIASAPKKTTPKVGGSLQPVPVNPKPYVAPGTNQPGSGSTQQGAPPQPPNGQPQTPYQQEQPQQPVNPGEDLLSPGASPSYPADIPNFPPHAPELDDLQHCHDGLAYCPFTCHTQCPCYDWCKNAKCPQSQGGIYIDGEGFFDATCDSGPKSLMVVCSPYCFNFCGQIRVDIDSRISDPAVRAQLANTPLECNKARYQNPGAPRSQGPGTDSVADTSGWNNQATLAPVVDQGVVPQAQQFGDMAFVDPGLNAFK